jgi:hypothetical protein
MMIKALVVKELRESAGLIALAVLGAVYALSGLTGTPILPWQYGGISGYPFFNDSLPFYFCLVAGGLAIALGFKQTAWEMSFGTYYFLLHRPVNRRRIFGQKLLVGVTLVMSLSALFLLAFASWAITPGHFAAPFLWSMTVPGWQMWTALPPAYFGAFLSGVRPGRWYGTRLLPLIAAIFIAAIAANMPWFWLTMLISLVASALLILDIFYYVRERDF